MGRLLALDDDGLDVAGRGVGLSLMPQPRRFLF
jgi:hypothetical protein